MTNRGERLLLVGDNPFHGISHLSQERGRERSDTLARPEEAAGLVRECVSNGANGFMFSVSNSTLSILKVLRDEAGETELALCPIIPYAYEYVRYAVQAGVLGLAARLSREITLSLNARAAFSGLAGLSRRDPASLLRSYVSYEVSRIKSAINRGHSRIHSIFLHEIITDMALSLKLDGVLKAYVDVATRLKIIPGFETRNFAYLVARLAEWGIKLDNVMIAAPFNKAGFQMSPSREECERALASLRGTNLIAMSTMAGGYLSPGEGLEYVSALPNLGGIVLGVSNELQARESFGLAREWLMGVEQPLVQG